MFYVQAFNTTYLPSKHFLQHVPPFFLLISPTQDYLTYCCLYIIFHNFIDESAGARILEHYHRLNAMPGKINFHFRLYDSAVST